MTKRKYIRLLLVCFLPLLIAGIVTSEIFIKDRDYIAVTCEQYDNNYDNCRYVGDHDSPLYKSVKSKSPLWFGMSWEELTNSRSRVFAEATARRLNDIRVSDVSPYVGQRPSATDAMKSLVGLPNTSIQLGFDQGQRSYYGDTFTVLACHDLIFKNTSNDYEASCFGEGWGGVVTFEAFGDSKATLNSLKTRLDKEVKAFFIDRMIRMAVLWPMFIYLFLLMSAVAFVAGKAIRYVKAG